MLDNVACILTDIEGTTTSVSFVYDTLFPYFKNRIWDILEIEDNRIKSAFEEIRSIVNEEENIELGTNEEIVAKILEWCEKDRKITPLKTLQGILWKKGYEDGTLQGHVYDDVPLALEKWKGQGLILAVFSSGSVEAQKLIFGYSSKGNLVNYFTDFFDTKTGMKRDKETYSKIASILDILPSKILFLSDIAEELEAACEAGYQTLQLTRPGTDKAWKNSVNDFLQIT